MRQFFFSNQMQKKLHSLKSYAITTIYNNIFGIILDTGSNLVKILLPGTLSDQPAHIVRFRVLSRDHTNIFGVCLNTEK